LDETDFINKFKGEDVWCYEFPESQKLSVYLFSIVAGPYVTHESEKDEIKNYRIPLKIYSRKSIQKYVAAQKESYFNVTKSGIDFYETLFSTKYPFDKLDQNFIPDYKMGAMENVGNITYRDDYVPREEHFSQTRT